MRSFTKLIRGDDPNFPVSGWQPPQVDDRSALEEQLLEDGRRLLDILGPSGITEEIRKRNRGSAFYKTLEDVQTWNPGAVDFTAQEQAIDPSQTQAQYLVGTQAPPAIPPPVVWTPLNFDKDGTLKPADAAPADVFQPFTSQQPAKANSFPTQSRQKPEEQPDKEETPNNKNFLDLQALLEDAHRQAQLKADELIAQRLIEAQKKVEQMAQIAQAELEAVQVQLAQEIETTWQQTHVEIEAERSKAIEEARQQGLQSGMAEGHEAGHKEGLAMLESATLAAKNILQQFNEWRDEMLKQSEDTVVDMVKEMARLIFSDGVKLDQATLQQVFTRVLNNARTLGDLRVYVNPEDARLIDPAWREYQSLSSGQKIKIFPAEAIRLGGCYIEGQLGSMDARVETQLTAMLESLSNAQQAKASYENEEAQQKSFGAA